VLKKFQCNLTMALLGAALLSGCALTTANLNVAYKPDEGSKSPLSMIKPAVVQLVVEDKRLPQEQDRVGNKKNGFGAAMAPIKTNEQPSRILYDALKTEFTQNGHTVIDTADGSKPDLVLSVDLQRYWCDATIHFWDVEVIGTINSSLLLRTPLNDTVLLSQPQSSTVRESRQVVTESAWESVLNRALSEYVRSFSRDPNVLDAMKKAVEAVHGETPE